MLCEPAVIQKSNNQCLLTITLRNQFPTCLAPYVKFPKRRNSCLSSAVLFQRRTKGLDCAAKKVRNYSKRKPRQGKKDTCTTEINSVCVKILSRSKLTSN